MLNTFPIPSRHQYSYPWFINLLHTLGPKREMSSFEWQIRQVHDSIQNNNVKHAIQQCQKYIKKHPEALVFKILYSLCLVSIKKLQEANNIAEELLSKMPKQDSVNLSIMKCVLEKLNRHKDSVNMYESAVIEQPFHEELANDYFNVLIERMDFQSAYQLSIRLYKRFNNCKYYFWAILAIYHQSQLSRSFTSIKIVQKMVHKALQDEMFNTFQEYSICLLVQNHEDQSLKILLKVQESVFPTKIDAVKWKFGFLKPTDNAAEIIAIAKSFDSIFDDWYIIEYYILACKHLNMSLKETLFWNKSTISSFQNRNRLLAELYTYSLWEQMDSLYKSILDYFEAFGHKEICFSDLIPYLRFPGIDYTSMCLEHFFSASKLDDMDKHNQEKLLTILKIIKYSNPMYPCDSIIKAISSNELSGERKVTLVMLSLVDMLHVAIKKDSMQYCPKILFQAAAFINNAIKNDKLDNYSPLKLILISILRELRGTAMATELFRSLDIKLIQTDILGYLIFDWISVIIHPEYVIQNCTSMLSIYSSNENETPNMLAKAFQNGSFSQTVDFVDFYIRLSNSLQRKAYQVTKIQAELVKAVFDMTSIEKCLSCVSSILPFGTFLYDNRPVDELYSVWWSFHSISRFIQRNELKGEKWVNVCHGILVTLDMLYRHSEYPKDYENTFSIEIKGLVDGIISEVTACKESSGIISIFSLTLHVCQRDETMILNELDRINQIISGYLSKTLPDDHLAYTPDKLFEILDEFVETVHYVGLYYIGLSRDTGYISARGESFSEFLRKAARLIEILESVDEWIESFMPRESLFCGNDDLLEVLHKDWANIVERSILLVKKSREMLQNMLQSTNVAL